jgi:hypothetical protein
VIVVGRLLHAELLKVRTTIVLWALVGAMALLVAGLVALTVGTGDEETLAGENGVRSVLPLGAQMAYFFTLAVGVIGMAGEYRHGTIGHTLLGAPARWQVIVAKVVAYAVVGLLFGVVAVALTYGISGPWMESKDYGWSLENTLPKEIIAGSLVGTALFGVIGVGLAALLKDQVAALFVGVGWTLLVDTVVSGVAPEVGKFLPGGALAGLTNGSVEDLLDPALGGLVLLGYAAVFVALGAIASQRRDLT